MSERVADRDAGAGEPGRDYPPEGVRVGPEPGLRATADRQLELDVRDIVVEKPFVPEGVAVV